MNLKIAFFRILWYNKDINRAALCRHFYFPASAGFYVHGGWEPGSNGCIDLTSQMDDFTKWFENNGHDLIINVKYQR